MVNQDNEITYENGKEASNNTITDSSEVLKILVATSVDATKATLVTVYQGLPAQAGVFKTASAIFLFAVILNITCSNIMAQQGKKQTRRLQLG